MLASAQRGWVRRLCFPGACLQQGLCRRFRTEIQCISALFRRARGSSVPICPVSWPRPRHLPNAHVLQHCKCRQFPISTPS